MSGYIPGIAYLCLSTISNMLLKESLILLHRSTFFLSRTGPFGEMRSGFKEFALFVLCLASVSLGIFMSPSSFPSNPQRTDAASSETFTTCKPTRLVQYLKLMDTIEGIVAVNGSSHALNLIKHLVEESKYSDHNLSSRHKLAMDTDPARPNLPANLLGQRFTLPESVQDNNSLSVWGHKEFQFRLRKWREKSYHQRKVHKSQISLMRTLPMVNRETLLVQRSISMFNIGYDSDVKPSAQPGHAIAMERPLCDLRGCDQKRFPLIYIVIGHRNRPRSVLRLIQSIRNVTLQCDIAPAWLKCLCVYVSDCGSTIDYSLAAPLRDLWDGHIRLLSRENLTENFSRGSVSSNLVRTL